MYGAYLPEETAEARARPRLGRAADRAGRRVRLLRLAGDQGAAGRRRRHGPRQSEHRDDPDERAASPTRSTSSPVTPEFVERIIVKEEVDAILLAFGGQTALNCGLALDDAGVFEQLRRARARHADRGHPRHRGPRAVRRAPGRDRREDGAQPGVPLARRKRARPRARSAFRSCCAAATRSAARAAASSRHRGELDAALRRAFAGGVPQVLVEECLRGWKEIEYEVVRDGRDNCITVCNMENLDPMGIHTGESIVVAPSQTLDDEEYQLLRSDRDQDRSATSASSASATSSTRSIRTASDYRVIEVNARLSRSSALASKATGYPLAYVAAKIALGYALPEIPNAITRRTTAFFEPALDYIVCKVPRWDLGKFRGASTRIGSEMKSVGEVMAIGRTFPEVLQKALRMLDIGVRGLDPDAFRFDDVARRARRTRRRSASSPSRRALRDGMSVDEIHELTRIDRWFLHAHRARRATCTRRFASRELAASTRSCCASAKRWASPTGRSARAARSRRRDRCAQAAHARTASRRTWRRSTRSPPSSPPRRTTSTRRYHATARATSTPSGARRSWCSARAPTASARASSSTGAASTRCRRRPSSATRPSCSTTTRRRSAPTTTCATSSIFDEISLETVLDLYEREQPDGVVVSMGGQMPNNLAHAAAPGRGAQVLGTSPESIDRAEDRSKFSALLDELGIDQPRWAHVTDVADAGHIVAAARRLSRCWCGRATCSPARR